MFFFHLEPITLPLFTINKIKEFEVKHTCNIKYLEIYNILFRLVSQLF